MVAERFDAMVIGAGQAGGPLATALASAGKKTAGSRHSGAKTPRSGVCPPSKSASPAAAGVPVDSSIEVVAPDEKRRV